MLCHADIIWETQINHKYIRTLFSDDVYPCFYANIVYMLIDLFDFILGRWPFITAPFNREGSKGIWKFNDCRAFTQLVSNGVRVVFLDIATICHTAPGLTRLIAIIKMCLIICTRILYKIKMYLTSVTYNYQSSIHVSVSFIRLFINLSMSNLLIFPIYITT